ncbi:MAG: polysaccharide biosynthesis tyrosine autokinase [Bergeyella sp.]
MNDRKKTEELDLNGILKPYLKHWWWFVISVFAFLVLAVLYIKFSAPRYSTETSVLIKDAKKMSYASGDFGALQDMAGFGAMATNSIENELEIFKSKKIISDAVKDLGLQNTLYSPEKYYKVELYGDISPIIVTTINEKPFEKGPKKPIQIEIKGDKLTLSSEEMEQPIVTTFNKTISLPYANLMIQKNPDFNIKKAKDLKNLNNLELAYGTFDDAVDAYRRGLKVDLADKNATVVLLSVEGANKDKSQDFLNSIVRQYNIDATTDKNIESRKTKEFIDERINLISQELGEVERQREQFKIDNNVIDIPTESRLNIQLANQRRMQEVETETQIQYANMLLDYLNKRNPNQTLPANIGIDNEAASKNVELYNALVLQRNKILENATEENPLVKELDMQLKQMRASIREGLTKHISSLNLLLGQFSSEKHNLDSKIGKVPSLEKLFRNIERQQQIKENLYLLLLQKREEAAISLAMTADKARVVDLAYTAKKPVSPQKMIILGGAFLLGLLLPLSYIYIRELLDNTIKSKHDIEKLSKIPVISEIPRLAKGEESLIQMNDVSPMAEAFRILVTNLNFILPKKEKDKKILVTSSTKGEGKTFVSINLALAIASPKRKVLLIGCDIRNPQLQRYSKDKSRAEGLTEYLADAVDNARDIIHASNFSPYCDIIYSGSIPPNPTDLLENGRYEKLLKDLEGIYDFIIVDSAPLMLVTDTFLISHHADAVIYITRSEVTEQSFIDFANMNAEKKKIKNVNFVLNDVHKSNFGYGNKYGYGYHAERKKWWKIFKI